MMNNRNSFRNIHLTSIDDEEYIAWMRRMADLRPSRGGRRSAGEYLGGLVERCVRHAIGKQVPLTAERILAWEQRLKNGRNGPMFRELDAVWQIDEESLCLFEMKLTRPENMEKGTGIKQLNTAAGILFDSGEWKYILKRLVYIAEEAARVPVLEDVPCVDADEEYEELGVVWITPELVEQAAAELEVELPKNWSEPEAREGDMDDPERDSWRQFLPQEGETSTESVDENSPVAQALRKALGAE
jgi:hypothetical protein